RKLRQGLDGLDQEGMRHCGAPFSGSGDGKCQTPPRRDGGGVCSHSVHGPSCRAESDVRAALRSSYSLLRTGKRREQARTPRTAQSTGKLQKSEGGPWMRVCALLARE